MNTNAKILLPLLVIILFVSSCSPAIQTASTKVNPTFTVASGSSDAYPNPSSEKDVSKAYPAGSMSQPKIYGPNELPPTPASIPEPKSGSGAISGTLFSFSNRILIPSTIYYLTKAKEGDKVPALFVGPDTSKGDISGRTDDKSQFSLDNVPPGTYYMAVWSAYTWEVVIDKENEPQIARAIVVKEGQKNNLGIVLVSWP